MTGLRKLRVRRGRRDNKGDKGKLRLKDEMRLKSGNKRKL